MDIYEEIVRIRASGERAALATIVKRLGSTPRKDAAKMLIYPDGRSLGSVGGGCVEAEVWQQANQVMESGRATLICYELNEDDAEKEGLVCGGSVEIFLEPIMSDPQLIVLGAGHLGQEIAELAHRIGFQVTVIDDRETFANPDRFPEGVEVAAREFPAALQGLDVGASSYILIVTRGHKHDQAATEAAIQTNARYVGLVGSRRKIKIIVEALVAKGLSPDLFTKLYAPIGLDIGSETPQEIAVSVVAELISIRKGVHQRSPKQSWILKVLKEIDLAKSPESGTT